MIPIILPKSVPKPKLAPMVIWRVAAFCLVVSVTLVIQIRYVMIYGVVPRALRMIKLKSIIGQKMVMISIVAAHGGSLPKSMPLPKLMPST